MINPILFDEIKIVTNLLMDVGLNGHVSFFSGGPKDQYRSAMCL